jgi:hypothetical protein
MPEELQIEHEWLQQLVGEWTWESEAPGEPEGGTRPTGTESVRSLGGFWVLCEGRGETPDGGSMITLMSLGYDGVKGRYVGSFIASMMSHQWLYEGALDESGKTLVLDSEGPSYADETRMAKYKDSIEFVSADHRILSSAYQDDEGNWQQFMRAHYRRA